MRKTILFVATLITLATAGCDGPVFSKGPEGQRTPGWLPPDPAQAKITSPGATPAAEAEYQRRFQVKAESTQ